MEKEWDQESEQGLLLGKVQELAPGKAQALAEEWAH